MLQEKVTLLDARRRTLLLLLRQSRQNGDYDTVIAARAALGEPSEHVMALSSAIARFLPR